MLRNVVSRHVPGEPMDPVSDLHDSTRNGVKDMPAGRILSACASLASKGALDVLPSGSYATNDVSERMYAQLVPTQRRCIRRRMHGRQG